MNKLAKIRAEVEKLNAQLLRGACSSQIAMETMCKEEAYNEILAILDSMQEEPVSEELEEACEQLAENARKHKAETSSPFFSQTDYRQGVVDGVQWQEEHLWKPADGEDLPEYDREVIVLTQSYPLKDSEYAVSFAHRPDPKGWDGKSITTGKVEHYTPKTYGKGGWNIPDVKYWLDCSMPKEIEL